ncbi:hypothetical protein [Helicobacter sp. UBA3407]|uniref:hypothetical protein n=1 Tax=Helicobacter TaxID=209 RepID=UPI00260AEF10|nr:hypothetical protein [Helicobacter sp. UBA3407]
MAFGFILATFINFYYYEIYKTNIDIFIFGLKDDNTQAILSIIFKDYPLLILFFCAVVFTAFCVWLNTKILRLKLPTFNVKLPMILSLLLIFLALYVLALRGHLAMLQ